MKIQKIFNLLNKTDLDSKKFTTKRWYTIDPQATDYDAGKSIKFDTKVIKPNLCDYSEAYILVTGKINNLNANGNTVCFKNCAPFRSCTSHINDEYLENAENLDVVMPMYNLIEYSYNYEDSTGSLYQFKRDEITSGDDVDADIPVVNNVINSKPFDFRAKLVGTVHGNEHKAKLVVPLKHLSNFFRSLEMSLINCKINLELNWSQNCVLATHNGNGGNITFTITEARLYVPIVTLSNKDVSHLSKLLSERFKRSVFWNKYHVSDKTQTTPNNNDVRILVDASFQGVHRLIVLPFRAGNQNQNTENRDSYRKFYLPRVNKTNYNAIIDGRNFYDQPISSDERQYDELRKVTLGKGDDYTTGCLLDFAYFKCDYKIIADLRAIQQIKFKGTVGAESTIMTVLEESKEAVLEFFTGTAKII